MEKTLKVQQMLNLSETNKFSLKTKDFSWNKLKLLVTLQPDIEYDAFLINDNLDNKDNF